MDKRGRKSTASLSVAPAVGRERPEPPESLPEAQKATWRAIVNMYPPEYFLTTLALLEAYCRHCECASVIDREVDAFDVEWLGSDDGLKRFDKLLAIRERQTSVMMALARSMRMTNQARYTPQAAATATGKSGFGKKPWERG